MPEGNPLVAAPQSQTTAVTGIGIAESAGDLASGIKDGSWVEGGLGALGVGLEVLSLVVDPIGTLAQYGVSWLIEHVQPLKECLDWLAGDPPVIQSFADTWGNVAKEVGAVGGDLANEVKTGTAGWTGAGADAYRASGAERADALAGAAELSDGISTGVMIMGQVVAAVRETVRDLVAELVGKLITWALEEAASLGFATPVVAAQATAAITKAINKVSDLVRKLVKTIGNVTPLIRKVVDKLDEIIQKLAKLGRKLDGGTTPSGARHVDGTPSPHAPDTTAPSATHTPDGTSPSSTRAPDSTSPSSAATSPSSTSPSGTSPSSTSPGSPDPTAPTSSTPDGPTAPSGTKDGPASRRDGGPLADDARDPQSRSTEPVGRCGRREPIDMASGEMFLVQRDVELPGVLPLVLERVHVSSYRAGRSFGRSWASTVDQRVEATDDGVYYAGPDGVILCYPVPPADGEVLPVAGARWPLARTADGGWTIRQPQTGITLYFSGAGAGLTALTDRAGHRIDIDRDDTGTATAVRHSAGYRVIVDSAEGRIRELRLRGATDTAEDDVTLARFVYSPAGDLIEVHNSSGRPLEFSYDEQGRIVSWRDRNGQWYQYDYDRSGRCVRTEGSGHALAGTIEYDPEHRLTRETNSLGHVREYHFDELGRLAREIDPRGHEWQRSWDAHGRLLSETDPLGRTTRHRYDDVGNPIEVLRPDGLRAVAEYDERSLPVRTVDPDGGTWRRAYDERGNLTSLTDPAGAVTTLAYDGEGRLTAVTDAVGVARAVRTDRAGLVLAVTDPVAGTTEYRRDRFGRIVSVTEPGRGTTLVQWTVEGRILSRTTPDGATQRWAYDGEGNEVAHTDRAGAVTRTWTTHFDLPAVELDPLGGRTEYHYDSELNLVGVVNPQGLRWTYEYDDVGNLVQEKDFDGVVTRFEHDAAGQLVRRSNAAGQSVRFERDPMGAVLARHYDDGSVATFERDPLGRVLRARNAVADVRFERDPIGRVLTETRDGRAVSSSYDPLGRRVSRQTATGVRSAWSYDAGSRPVSLHTAGRTMAFGYDEAGREVERLLDTGTVLAQAWNHEDRLISQTVSTVRGGAASAATVLRHRSYAYQTDGRLTAIADSVDGVRRFRTDAAGRITGVRRPDGEEGYGYDAAANLTGVTGAGEHVDGGWEYTGTLVRRAGRTSYRYDEQGRLVQRRRQRLSAKADVWHYGWDVENRLTDVTTPDGSRWRYHYDALGRRVRKERLAPDTGDVAGWTEFLWDGVTLAEQVEDGVRATTWEYEPGTFRPVLQHEQVRGADDTAQWVDRQFHSIVADQVGAPLELVTAEGVVAWRAAHTLWGGPRGGGDTSGTPLRFPGQYHDPESGLDYNYLRHYDPETGRYASVDPLGLDGGPNPRAYVPNPTSAVDPLGLLGCGDADQSSTDPLAEARRRRDEHAENLKAQSTNRRPPPAAVTAGYDPATGRIEVGASNKATHGCAENEVAQKLGIPRDQIQFTEAVRPRTGAEVPICPSCQGKYQPNQFPHGTQADPSGGWGVSRVGE